MRQISKLMFFHKTLKLNKGLVVVFENLLIPSSSFRTQLKHFKDSDICEFGDLCPPLYSFAPHHTSLTTE